MIVKLVDIFNLQMGKTPARNNKAYWNDGEYDWISISDLGNNIKYVSSTKEKITELAIKESGIKKVPSHTLLMSFKLSVGKTAITKYEVYTNEAIMAFIPNHKYDVYIDYFYYLFSWKDWSNDTSRAVMGATLNKSTLGQIMVKIPPLDEQRKIAETLDKLSDLIAKRKQQLEKLDLLVKSRFIEMFGDPVSNTKHYEEVYLNDLGILARGVSKHRPRNAPELLGGKYPLIQTGEVANSNLYIATYENTYSELGLRQSKMWDAGTLCITIAANIAKTAILTFDACFPDSIVGFMANENTNNIYIHFWFSFFQEILESQAPESAQKNINMKILSNLKIILPPINEQNQFSEFVKQTEKTKTIINQSLEKLETLKKMLMQEYFG